MERERQILHIESHAGGEIIRTSVQARATFTPNHARWIYTEKLSEDEAPVAETLEADVAAGAPVNPDGTVSLVEYAAWLCREEGDHAD